MFALMGFLCLFACWHLALIIGKSFKSAPEWALNLLLLSALAAGCGMIAADTDDVRKERDWRVQRAISLAEARAFQELDEQQDRWLNEENSNGPWRNGPDESWKWIPRCGVVFLLLVAAYRASQQQEPEKRAVERAQEAIRQIEPWEIGLLCDVLDAKRAQLDAYRAQCELDRAKLSAIRVEQISPKSV